MNMSINIPAEEFKFVKGFYPDDIRNVIELRNMSKENERRRRIEETTSRIKSDIEHILKYMQVQMYRQAVDTFTYMWFNAKDQNEAEIYLYACRCICEELCSEWKVEYKAEKMENDEYDLSIVLSLKEKKRRSIEEINSMNNNAFAFASMGIPIEEVRASLKTF